jgi:uncharacterized membrane protein YkgB
MIDRSQAPVATLHRVAQSLTRGGQLISRYGLVVVLAWIGFGKYVKMESRVLIEHSPLMSWIYDVLSVTMVARGSERWKSLPRFSSRCDRCRRAPRP